MFMVKFVKSFLRDESGASAAEYALILAVIGSAIAVAALALGGEINEAITRAEGDVADANATAEEGVDPDTDGTVLDTSGA
jgi:pilus assembly protein Flp/PilA